MPAPGPATYFATPAEFRRWLARNHAKATELLVGFHKVDSGHPSMTWPQSVDEALCFGWIDGVRRRVDAARYSIRFTPRKLQSTWSAVNIARVAELTAAGRMKPAGLAAYARRTERRSRVYAYEQERGNDFSPAQRRAFRAARAAWAFFEAQAAWYRRRCVHWVSSARQEETRERRFEALVAASAAGRRL